MPERLMGMGFPIDWCELALKNSSGLEAAVDLLIRWRQEALQLSQAASRENAASNNLTAVPLASASSTASDSAAQCTSESTGGSTNHNKMFPVISSTDAVVPQACGNRQQQAGAPYQERNGSDRKAFQEMQGIKKVLSRPAPVDPVRSLTEAIPKSEQGGATRAFSVEWPLPSAWKMDTFPNRSQSGNNGAAISPSPLVDDPCFPPFTRGERSGGSLELQVERVRKREVALLSAARRMSEAAEMFREGLQPFHGEPGGGFHCPASPEKDDGEDEQAVDEGWTSIMDIDEPQMVSAADGRRDSICVSSTGTSTEEDNQSVDGPECALNLQRGLPGKQQVQCVMNQQSNAFTQDSRMLPSIVGRAGKSRGRAPSESWCPDPPRKLQRTWQEFHPHDPGIGILNGDQASGRAQQTFESMTFLNVEQSQTQREGKEHVYKD